MPVTVGNIKESVANPSGRFRTLADVYVRRGADGELLTMVSRDSVTFGVVVSGRDCDLTCFLRRDARGRIDLERAAAAGALRDSEYLLPTTFLADEMMVFDSLGGHSWVDVFLQPVPAGERLDRFVMRRGPFSGAELRRIFTSLSDAYAGLAGGPATVSGVGLRNIFINEADGCRIIIGGPGLRYKDDAAGANNELLAAVLTFFLFANSGGLYAGFSSSSSFHMSNLRGFLGRLRGNVTDPALNPLARLVSTAISGDSRYPADMTLEDVGALAGLVDGRWESIQRLAGDSAPLPGRSDVSRCDWIGPASGGLRCVREGGRWKYVREDGAEAFEGGFLHASDFDRGRAVVETGTGFGLIDRSGAYVMQPVYEDLCWDADDGVVRAMRKGYFALYDRDGNDVTWHVFDMISAPSCGLLLAQRDGYYGYLDLSGAEATGFVYDDAYSFDPATQTALVDLGGRWLRIDLAGDIMEK